MTDQPMSDVMLDASTMTEVRAVPISQWDAAWHDLRAALALAKAHGDRGVQEAIERAMDALWPVPF